jgi:hypothetical protein
MNGGCGATNGARSAGRPRMLGALEEGLSVFRFGERN